MAQEPDGQWGPEEPWPAVDGDANWRDPTWWPEENATEEQEVWPEPWPDDQAPAEEELVEQGAEPEAEGQEEHEEYYEKEKWE